MTSLLPNPHHSDLINEALQNIPAEGHEKWIEAYLNLLLKSFTGGLMGDFKDEKPDHIVRRLEQIPAVRFILNNHLEGIAMVHVHPLVVDELTRRAYYPVITGLSVWPRGSVPDDVERLLWKTSPPDLLHIWSPTQREPFWDTVFAELEALEAPLRTGPEDDVSLSTEYSSPTLPTPEVMALTA